MAYRLGESVLPFCSPISNSFVTISGEDKEPHLTLTHSLPDLGTANLEDCVSNCGDVGMHERLSRASYIC